MPFGAIAGSIAGSAIGGAFNAREASKNRDFQEKMSRTQYQRAAADLEKAGLNRVLALGSPASQPSGAQASMESPKIAESGIAAASAKQAIAQGKAQETLLGAQTAETLEKTRLTSAEAAKAEVEKGLYDALGPAAKRLFEGLGSNVDDAIGDGNPVDALIDSVIERGKAAATEIPRRMWDNFGPSAWGRRARDLFNRAAESDRNRRERKKDD